MHTTRSAATSMLGATLVVATLLMTAAVPGLAGEWEHAREGWVIGANLGGGSADLNEDGFDTQREAGGSGNFRVGWALRPELTGAFEASLWSADVGGVTWTFSVAGPALTWFPEARGYFVRGGLGVGTIEAKVSAQGTTVTFSNSGFGVFAATGYEWRLTRRFALGPQLDFGWMDVGDGLSANFINGSAALNWYF